MAFRAFVIGLPNALANVNPTPLNPGQGNVGHRWGISGDWSIEQVPGGVGLANFGFVLLIIIIIVIIIINLTY